MTLLIILALAKGAVWVLEQPVSSIIWRHPRLRWLLQSSRVACSAYIWSLELREWVVCLLLEAFRCAFWMLRFGARSPKRTRLWSNSRGIRHFASARPLTKHERIRRGGDTTLATSSVGRDGKKKFTGKKDALRKSG